MCFKIKKIIYIAGPLFSKAELDYNLQLSKFLANSGFDTFLPQRDGYLLSELLDMGFKKKEAVQKIFKFDTSYIKMSDAVVFVMDGRVPDEGACIEVGIAYALGKECFGLKTDSRCLTNNMDNPMITGVLKGRVAESFSELESLLKKWMYDWRWEV